MKVPSLDAESNSVSTLRADFNCDPIPRGEGVEQSRELDAPSPRRRRRRSMFTRTWKDKGLEYT